MGVIVNISAWSKLLHFNLLSFLGGNFQGMSGTFA